MEASKPFIVVGTDGSPHAERALEFAAEEASVDMFGLNMDDFIPQVRDIISVGEFYELAAGGQVIFT